MTSNHWDRARVVAGTAVLLIVMGACAGNRAVSPPAPSSIGAGTRPEPTREQLESLAAQVEREAQQARTAEERARKQAEATTIRQRLQEGDFHVGDRIALVVRGGDSTLNDTVVVRAGRLIQLPNIPDIPLAGVLHSELDGYLTKELSRYLKAPEVESTPLVQIAVLGPVGHPGFFSVPSDMTLTDAIMLAGGPTQGGDVNKTQIRRDNRVIKEAEIVRQAFAAGTTLDQMNLRAGDQIVVGEKKRSDWLRVVQIAAFALGAFGSIYALTHD